MELLPPDATGATSCVRAGTKRSHPGGASLSEGAVNSPRRRMHKDDVAQPPSQLSHPSQQPQQPHPLPLAAEGRDVTSPHIAPVTAAAAAAAAGGHSATPRGVASAAATVPGAGSGDGESGAGIVLEGRCLLEMHMVHQEVSLPIVPNILLPFDIEGTRYAGKSIIYLA